MERLPFIDEHSAEFAASPRVVWEALRSVLRRELGVAPPAVFINGMRLEPSARRGDWSAPIAVGDALPGFQVDDLEEPNRLALVGHHRLSRYALIFELDDLDGRTRLRAQTWAEFPGVLGRGYKAMVIGTRMHRLAVRRLLRRVGEGT